MTTTDIILITVIANLILQPLFSYLISSRCSRIKICCIECDREVLTKKEIDDEQNKHTEPESNV